MPFLAPVATAIGAAISSVAAITIAGVQVGQMLLMASFSMAVNAIFRQKPSAGQFDRGTQATLSSDPNYPREWIYGTAKTAGSLVYVDEVGTNNEDLWMVIALADRKCNALNSIIVDGRVVTWDSGTGIVSEYSNGGTDYLKIRFYDGSDSQTADSAMVSAVTAWTTAHRGRGVAYVVIEAKWNADLFQSGIPRMQFVVDGAPIYDPRKDSTVTGGSGSQRDDDPTTWTWDDGASPAVPISKNMALMINDYLRGHSMNGQRIGGMVTPVEDIPQTDVQTAASTCDESVTLKAGGSEYRYHGGLIVSTASPHRENIRNILGGMAGKLIDQGGTLYIQPGEAKTSVLTINDDDLVTNQPFEYEPKRGRDEIVNRIAGRYVEPDDQYNAVEYPARGSATYETEDGGQRWLENFDLVAVQSNPHAQRVAEQSLRRSRLQGRLTCVVGPEFIELEAGDWFTFDSTRYGWTGGSVKLFEVEAITFHPGGEIGLVAQEVAATIDDWTAATDEITPAGVVDPTPPAAGAETPGKFGGLAVQDDVSWTTDVTARPAELTDGRITAALDSSGNVQNDVKVRQLGGTDTRSLGRALEVLAVQDGDSVTFATNFDEVPTVKLMGGTGRCYDTSLESSGTVNQYQDFSATNVTVSGFTARCKIRNGGTTTARSDGIATPGTGSQPDKVGHKSTADEAVDKTYTFNGTATGTAGSEGGSITVGVYTLSSAGGSWVQRGTVVVTILTSGSFSKSWSKAITLDGLGQHAGYEFGVTLESSVDVTSPALSAMTADYTSTSVATEVDATDQGENVFAFVFESNENLVS